MHKLDLDFAARRTALRKLGVIGFVLAFAICLYLAYAYFAMTNELSEWETQWRRAQKAAQIHSEGTTIPKAEWERMQIEFKTANRIIERLNLPWDSLFREIESSVYEQVTLLSVEPDTEKKEVRITAEAKDFAAMLEYEKRLQSLSLFRDPHITSHEIQQQDAQKPVRFVVIAQWVEPAKVSSTAAVPIQD